MIWSFYNILLREEFPKMFWWGKAIYKTIKLKKEAYIRWISSKKEEDKQIFRSI